ncbi:MAG: hypothetical protein KIH63_002165 [Candidatus Saccharibacteria bacterium]|nr:hypothetical protein [Candidatus Saccharibacteria bacterium]
MANKSGETTGAGEAIAAVVSVGVLAAFALGVATDRIKFTGTDEGGEYTWMHDEEGYGAVALPMTDRVLIFSPTPFTPEDRVYVEDITQEILRNRKIMEAERSKAIAAARFGVPYEPNASLTATEAQTVVSALQPLGLVCPEGAATSLYKPPEPGAADIQQDICVDYATAQVIDGRVSVALAPEPKVGIPNPDEVYLAFESREPICIWLANTYFPILNGAVVAELGEEGTATTPAPQYDVALRMNRFFADPCDSVAGDAVGIPQLDTSNGVLTS